MRDECEHLRWKMDRRHGMRTCLTCGAARRGGSVVVPAGTLRCRSISRPAKDGLNRRSR